MTAKTRTAAQALVDQLVLHGVTHVFCVPGESYLAVLDALHDSPIVVTVCRQEGGAAMMAEAVGKATGRPGVCFVTRGPGATNASPGIHIADQDSTPMILFVGQIQREDREREAFQEMDYRAVFGSMSKWTAEINDASRMPEFISRAFLTATSGRPGPVVLALPEDMLREPIQSPDAPAFHPIETAPAQEDLQALAGLIAGARRPLFVIGGARWDEASRTAMRQFSEHFDMAVATSYRRLPLFDPLHPNYAGDLGLSPNPKLVARVKAADLVVFAGARMNEITTQGFTLFDIPKPAMTFVHLHPGPEELGRIYAPDLAINASPARFAPALAALVPPVDRPWADHTAEAHGDYLAWSEVATDQPGPVNPGAIMVWLRENLPSETILCNGAGNYAAWIHRFYRFRRFAAHIAPTSASMGYGVPAAVGIKRIFPDRPVICVAGDGDFLMNGQEFATAVQYGLPLVVIILDNASYGTIRMHQEREYPGRVSATDLRNPDFAAYARAFGGFGVTVEATEDFPEAFRAAEAFGGPAIVHVKVDTDAIMPGATLTAIRQRALAGRTPAA